MKNMHAGWRDSPLTPLGESQALLTRPLVEGIEFSRIYASDLSRAKRTAELIFGSRDMVLSESLREINMEIISGISFSDLEKKYGSKYIEYRKRWDFSPFGCESVPHFLERAGKFFDALEKESETLDKVAIVTHAGIIRALASRVIGVRFSDRYTLKIDNASVSVLEYLPDKGWRIEHWNYTPQI